MMTFFAFDLTIKRRSCNMNVVQFGGDKMNKMVTSKEAILDVSRNLAATQGLKSINMRSVAKECHVAVGSIYNYFPSKGELITATIESIWLTIFHNTHDCLHFNSFVECIEWIYQQMLRGTKEYPDFFFIHSDAFGKENKELGKQEMLKYFEHMCQNLHTVLRQDQLVKRNVFHDSLKEEDFIEFVFVSMLNALSQHQSSCQVLIEIIKKVIYEST